MEGGGGVRMHFTFTEWDERIAAGLQRESTRNLLLIKNIEMGKKWIKKNVLQVRRLTIVV